MNSNPVLGVVLNDERLTLVTRVSNWYMNLAQHENVPVHKAVNLIFAEANRHRSHCTVHAGGNGALQLVAALSRTELPIQAFQWLAPVSSPIYANAGSEAFSQLQEQVMALAVKMPEDPALARELVAFTRDETSGKARYPSPEAIAPELGHYPARAFALLLANRGAAPMAGASVQQNTGGLAGHDPYSCLTTMT